MPRPDRLPLALPGAIAAGYWDRCPHCDAPVYLPVAGSRDSKVPVRCPGCQQVIIPEC